MSIPSSQPPSGGSILRLAPGSGLRSISLLPLVPPCVVTHRNVMSGVRASAQGAITLGNNGGTKIPPRTSDIGRGQRLYHVYLLCLTGCSYQHLPKATVGAQFYVMPGTKRRKKKVERKEERKKSIETNEVCAILSCLCPFPICPLNAEVDCVCSTPSKDLP